MLNCARILILVNSLAQLVNSEDDHTAANYLCNVDIIIARQLENPVEEDAEDLKDNIDEYVTVLRDLLKSVQNRDKVGVVTAKQYWSKGMPQFFHEERNGDIFLKLTTEFSWPKKAARELTDLIDKAKLLWSTFDAWYKEQVKLHNS